MRCITLGRRTRRHTNVLCCSRNDKNVTSTQKLKKWEQKNAFGLLLPWFSGSDVKLLENYFTFYKPNSFCNNSDINSFKFQHFSEIPLNSEFKIREDLCIAISSFETIFAQYSNSIKIKRNKTPYWFLFLTFKAAHFKIASTTHIQCVILNMLSQLCINFHLRYLDIWQRKGPQPLKKIVIMLSLIILHANDDDDGDGVA